MEPLSSYKIHMTLHVANAGKRPLNRKFLLYRNAAERGPSHCHKQHAQKWWRCSSVRFLRYVSGQQTDWQTHRTTQRIIVNSLCTSTCFMRSKYRSCFGAITDYWQPYCAMAGPPVPSLVSTRYCNCLLINDIITHARRLCIMLLYNKKHFVLVNVVSQLTSQ